MPQPSDTPEGAMKMFKSMIQISWLVPVIGIIEILGGILLTIKKIRALGA